MVLLENQAPSDPFELEKSTPFSVKYGSPFEADRGFIPVQSNRLDAVEIRGTEVRMLKQFKVNRDKLQLKLLRTTAHENIVNLQEVFLEDDQISFIYDEWGIPLEKICRQLYLGEVEVATICKNILAGLTYLHNDIGIAHGAIDLDNIHLMPDGGIKIANIGNCFVHQLDPCQQDQDILAVCCMTRVLLGPTGHLGTRGIYSCLLDDFLEPRTAVNATDLLKHPFLNFASGKWSLRIVRELYLVLECLDS
ncbi:kinase-like domain-containing protein [Aspergillus californicus]